jgi:hypothetical protein
MGVGGKGLQGEFLEIRYLLPSSTGNLCFCLGKSILTVIGETTCHLLPISGREIWICLG